jgi:hypothetical protein
LLTSPEPSEKLRGFYALLHLRGEEWRLQEAGVEVMMGGEGAQKPEEQRRTSLEESGHSLLLVDLLSLHKTFSFSKYRVDVTGFIAALLIVLSIIGFGVVLSGIGG